jgi:hypothetical protein
MITTQEQLRNEFWHYCPELKRIPGKTQNEYTTDVRVAWCDFVERMYRAGQISEKLAERATL